MYSNDLDLVFLKEKSTELIKLMVGPLFSHEWWVSLIKLMVGPTIHVRGRTTHL